MNNRKKISSVKKQVLLIGNPNVGKSVIFTRLTGVGVIASNYPGTTVEYHLGIMGTGDKRMKIIDVPGTYSLDPTSPAEQVAIDLLNKAIDQGNSVVVNVIDATNLERNLNLTLQLLKMNIPVIIALNLWDETKHIGISIDVAKLERILGVTVIPTVAVTGQGINSLVNSVNRAVKGKLDFDDQERWHEIGKIVEKVQVIKHRHHTFFERIGDLTIHPITGIPIAIAVLFLLFLAIRFIGEGLINHISTPLFERVWAPVMLELSSLLGHNSFLHKILIGRLYEGNIDFVQSFGMLTTGLYVPIGAVLPYIIAFYLMLSFMEDSGYLPRLAVLLDKTMHIVGLHGMAIIPMFLACGCNVPGILATRVLETKRERFIAATLMSISIPCIAQMAMIFALLGKYGPRALFPVFITLAIIWLIAGNIMKKLVKGESPEIFTEIPQYRFPHIETLIKKVWIRIRWFLSEALPYVLLGVLIVNLLYAFGIIDFLGEITAPLLKPLLGLPIDAIGVLLLGFLRKDLAVGMLLPLGLSMKQLIISCVVLTMYFPCVATFAVLLKELGILDTVKAMLIMIISALVVGIILNTIL